MSLYAISDLHLSFADTVDKPMDKFGPEWENHADRLCIAWNELVSDGDTVVIPGDISWAMSLKEALPDLEYIHDLPGKKVLLRGNHDYWWTSMNKMSGLYPSISFIQNNAYEGEDFVICGSRGWNMPWNVPKEMTAEENEKIVRRELLRMDMSLSAARALKGDKKLVVAMHYPPFDPSHKETDFTELFAKYGVDTVVYGHLHGKHIQEAVEGIYNGISYKLVSLDKLDATPIKIL